MHAGDRRPPCRISAPSARAALPIALLIAAGAALGDAPGAERAVDLAHVVVEQDVGRARALDALVRADDPRRRHRRLERIGLEPLVEEVRGAHRHELDEDRLLALRELLEAAGEAGQGQQRPRIEAGQVGRGDGQDRLDEPGHLDHQLAVFLVRLGVARRPAAQLADGPAVVVDPPQVVAAAVGRALALVERRERAVERQDVQAVPRQLEVADDLGPEQRDDVAEDREAEAREELLGHRGAAQDVALLEDEGLHAGAGEIGGADQAVVAAADDDRVVGLGHCSLLGRARDGAVIQPAYVSCSLAEADPRVGLHTGGSAGDRQVSVGTAFHPRDGPTQSEDAVAGMVGLFRVERLRRLPRHRVQRASARRPRSSTSRRSTSTS